MRQRIPLDVRPERIHQRSLDGEAALEAPHRNEPQRIHAIPAGGRQQPNDIAAGERAIARKRGHLRAKPRPTPADRTGGGSEPIRLANRQLAAARVSRAANDAVDQGNVPSSDRGRQLGQRGAGQSDSAATGAWYVSPSSVRCRIA